MKESSVKQHMGNDNQDQCLVCLVKLLEFIKQVKLDAENDLNNPSVSKVHSTD